MLFLITLVTNYYLELSAYIGQDLIIKVIKLKSYYQIVVVLPTMV